MRDSEAAWINRSYLASTTHVVVDFLFQPWEMAVIKLVPKAHLLLKVVS